MIQVGFVFTFDDGWMGGINYFRNLLTALYEYQEREIEAVVFTGFQSEERHFKNFPAVKIVRSRIFDRGTFPWLFRKLWQKVFAYDWLLERLLIAHGIAVLSHSGWIGKNAKIPAIGWITDFQHIHLPEFFNQKEIDQRNAEFLNLCHFCNTVIVSSYDALSDLRNFYPDCERRSEVLQFVGSVVDSETELPKLKELEMRYKFSGNYFFLPNQFWKHKNHRIVIEALGLLILEGKNVLVIATGNTKDYRHPQYFLSLMERAKELNALGNFKPLGLVPAQDFAALMRYSTAVINPSFFEGWSSSVEEAKSLGKPVLLADIPVHREQNPELATYFKPTDANALAVILWDVWNCSISMENDKNEHAKKVTNERRFEFAKNYQRIVLKVAHCYGPR